MSGNQANPVGSSQEADGIANAGVSDGLVEAWRTGLRGLVLAATLVVATALVSGCGEDDRSRLAAAKCAMFVEEEAGFPSHRLPTLRADVTDHLGEGRYRVAGVVTLKKRGGGAQGAEFTCEVEPDESDELRGLAVTMLEVGEVRDYR